MSLSARSNIRSIGAAGRCTRRGRMPRNSPRRAIHCPAEPPERLSTLTSSGNLARWEAAMCCLSQATVAVLLGRVLLLASTASAVPGAAARWRSVKACSWGQRRPEERRGTPSITRCGASRAMARAAHRDRSSKISACLTVPSETAMDCRGEARRRPHARVLFSHEPRPPRHGKSPANVPPGRPWRRGAGCEPPTC